MTMTMIMMMTIIIIIIIIIIIQELEAPRGVVGYTAKYVVLATG